MPASTTELRAREFWIVFALALVLACAMWWSLPLHLARDIPRDVGDPQLQAWQIAWDAHALLTQPLHLWNANIFYPVHDSLAFSDALLGYAPMGLLGGGPSGTLAAYNVTFLLVYAMSVAGPYALARELGIGRVGAAVCGIAFAYSPWRLEQSGHLHILSAGTMALAMALWLRGYRGRRPKAIFGGWLVCAWQVLIGVSLGLMMLYLTAILAIVVLVLWLEAHRPRVPRAVVVATVAGAVVVGGSLAVVAPAYLRVKHDHPEGARTLANLRQFSPPLRSFVTSSALNPVWGGATKGERDSLPAVSEQTLFPGATILLLAIVGLLFGRMSRRLRLALLLAGLIAFAFSLGLTLHEGRWTYRLLYDHAPGWDGVRTPGRFQTLTTLALALLAGAGIQALGARPGRRWGAALAVVASVGILAEGTALGSDARGGIDAPHPTPISPPPGLERVKAPYAILPTRGPGRFAYMVWSTRGFPKIVNGVSGFEPSLSLELRRDVVDQFPATADQLRAYGVRSVVVLSGEQRTRVPAPRGWRRYELGDGTVVFEDASAPRK